MPFPHSISKSGFTLLEIILAILIALMVMAVAVPSITTALGESPSRKAFATLDGMVQEAHSRSVGEQRNYVLVWGRDGSVLLRPETPANRVEAEGLQRWKIPKTETLSLRLPAALPAQGSTPEAVWTFWAAGACEPAEVHYKGSAGAWSASYNPFSVQAEVRYE